MCMRHVEIAYAEVVKGLLEDASYIIHEDNFTWCDIQILLAFCHFYVIIDTLHVCAFEHFKMKFAQYKLYYTVPAW